MGRTRRKSYFLWAHNICWPGSQQGCFWHHSKQTWSFTLSWEAAGTLYRKLFLVVCLPPLHAEQEYACLICTTRVFENCTNNFALRKEQSEWFSFSFNDWHVWQIFVLMYSCLVIAIAFPRFVYLATRYTSWYSLSIHVTVSLCQVSSSRGKGTRSLASTSKHCLFLWLPSHWESVGNGQVFSICPSAPFSRHGNYPRVTNICQIYESWEGGFRHVFK
jgi:hypothetical protein